MNANQFKISLTSASDLLKRFSLFKSIGPKGNGVYSKEFLEVSKDNDFVEIYKCAIKNLDYDILLVDDSIIQFQRNIDGELRYAYMQNPQKYVTKEDFLMSLYSEEELIDLSNDDIDSMLNDINEDDYNQFLTEQKLSSTSNYIRYDYSKAGYIPLVHSYSHMHIGMNENVRIPTSKIITPQKFTKFAIKNTYFDLWKSLFEKDENLANEILVMKSGCAQLSNDKWSEIEKNEMYLF